MESKSKLVVLELLAGLAGCKSLDRCLHCRVVFLCYSCLFRWYLVEVLVGAWHKYCCEIIGAEL